MTGGTQAQRLLATLLYYITTGSLWWRKPRVDMLFHSMIGDVTLLSTGTLALASLTVITVTLALCGVCKKKKKPFKQDVESDPQAEPLVSTPEPTSALGSPHTLTTSTTKETIAEIESNVPAEDNKNVPENLPLQSAPDIVDYTKKDEENDECPNAPSKLDSGFVSSPLDTSKEECIQETRQQSTQDFVESNADENTEVLKARLPSPAKTKIESIESKADNVQISVEQQKVSVNISEKDQSKCLNQDLSSVQVKSEDLKDSNVVSEETIPKSIVSVTDNNKDLKSQKNDSSLTENKEHNVSSTKNKDLITSTLSENKKPQVLTKGVDIENKIKDIVSDIKYIDESSESSGDLKTDITTDHQKTDEETVLIKTINKGIASDSVDPKTENNLIDDSKIRSEYNASNSNSNKTASIKTVNKETVPDTTNNEHKGQNVKLIDHQTETTTTDQKKEDTILINIATKETNSVLRDNIEKSEKSALISDSINTSESGELSDTYINNSENSALSENMIHSESSASSENSALKDKRTIHLKYVGDTGEKTQSLPTRSVKTASNNMISKVVGQTEPTGALADNEHVESMWRNPKHAESPDVHWKRRLKGVHSYPEEYVTNQNGIFQPLRKTKSDQFYGDNYKEIDNKDTREKQKPQALQKAETDQETSIISQQENEIGEVTEVYLSSSSGAAVETNQNAAIATTATTPPSGNGRNENTERVSTMFEAVTSLHGISRTSSFGSLGSMQADKDQNLDEELNVTDEPRSLEARDTRLSTHSTEDEERQKIRDNVERIRETEQRVLHQEGRRTPDLEEASALLSYPEQAVMKFNSETHRGNVIPEAAQVKDTFQLSEAQYYPSEETTAAPKDEDTWIPLTSEYSKRLEKNFRSLMKDMGESIPMFIQSMFKSSRWYKIYINIDAGRVPDAWAFIDRQCPSYRQLNVIEFVEQTSRPEFLNDVVEAGKLTGRARTRVMIGVEYLDSNGEVNAKYATVSGILSCKNIHISRTETLHYIVTVKHVFEDNIHNIWLKVLQPRDQPEDRANTIDLGNTVDGIQSYIKLNNMDKNVDVGIVRIMPEEFKMLKLQLKVQMAGVKKRPQVVPFTGGDKELVDKMVVKNGAESLRTRAKLLLPDSFQVVKGGKPGNGVLIVAVEKENYKKITARTGLEIRHFAVKGDSGALVQDHEQTSNPDGKSYAYAIVQSVLKEFKYPVQEQASGVPHKEYVNAALCVRLDVTIEAVKQKLLTTENGFEDVQFIALEDLEDVEQNVVNSNITEPVLGDGTNAVSVTENVTESVMQAVRGNTQPAPSRGCRRPDDSEITFQ